MEFDTDNDGMLDFEEFKNAMKLRVKEIFTDSDIRHIFDKVDKNEDHQINRKVTKYIEITVFIDILYSQEMRSACRYLCKQFNVNFKKVSLLYKSILSNPL